MKRRTRIRWSATAILHSIVFFDMTEECRILANVNRDRGIALLALLFRYTTLPKICILRKRAHSYPCFVTLYSCSVRVPSGPRHIILILLLIHGCFAANSWLKLRHDCCSILAFCNICRNFQWLVSLVTRTRSL
jgi:hypothetical protein